MSFITEFKEFAVKGNMVDMAVGIVIGGAFGKIITSLVADVLMPPIGMLLGGADFTSMKIIMKEAYVDVAGTAIPEVAIRYGAFIQTFIDFIIIALCIFFVIKAINKLKRKAEEPEAVEPEPTKSETLLTEIRDLLKK